MAKRYSSRSYGSSKSYSGKNYGSSGSSSRRVSSARLHQKSGSGNSFGGYTKVKQGDGAFKMRKTGR
jgi:hypothetical protein